MGEAIYLWLLDADPLCFQACFIEWRLSSGFVSCLFVVGVLCRHRCRLFFLSIGVGNVGVLGIGRRVKWACL